MIRKLLVVLVVVASVVGLFGAGNVYAAGATGTGPDQALAPGGDYAPLAAGETVWYAFTYTGDESQINVSMASVPATGAEFSIWTPEEIDQWARGLAVEPIGRGSGSVSWSGNFNRAGVYYVVATNTSSSTIWYRIDVSGAGVTYQTTVAEQAASPVAATSPTEATTTAKAAGGATPDQSLTIPAYYVSIAPGATIWHTFQYAGDQSQIRVWLDAQGQSGPGFSVWTPDQMRQYLTGSAVDPVGRGAYDANVSGDLTWSGSFPQNGAYYVQVTNSGSAVIEYTMSMSGSGVW